MTDKIDLIVCDIDNTLPVTNGRIDRSLLVSAEKFSGKGNTFCLASGRNYKEISNMSDNFPCVYICSDGALTTEKGKIIAEDVIEKNILNEIFSRTKSDFLLYGFSKVFCVSEDDEFIKAQREKYDNLAVIKTCNDVTENIYKVAFFKADDFDGAIRYVTMNKKLSRVYNFSGWKEFVSYGTNKGKALKNLMCLKGIKESAVCAFGDNINDMEMLKTARHSFAVANAKPEVKRLCKYLTDDVEKEILKITEWEEKI